MKDVAAEGIKEKLQEYGISEKLTPVFYKLAMMKNDILCKIVEGESRDQ